MIRLFLLLINFCYPIKNYRKIYTLKRLNRYDKKDIYFWTSLSLSISLASKKKIPRYIINISPYHYRIENF